MQKENTKILLADPNQEMVSLLAGLFEKAGFIVHTAYNGREAFDKAVRFQPHIVLAEVLLSNMDGIELCNDLRSTSLTKNGIIAFYTDRGEDYSQIAAFNAGADDYILKPIKQNVLLARVKALLKRLKPPANSLDGNERGLKIDRERYVVVLDGYDIVLPRKEFELLALLYSSPRKVFSRQEIARLIWGYTITPRNRTIDVHIRKLREKLGEKHIKTMKGIGYSLEP